MEKLILFFLISLVSVNASAQNRDAQVDRAMIEFEIANLKKESSEMREIAARNLARYGSQAKAAAPVLKEMLQNDEPTVQCAAYWALHRIGFDEKTAIAPMQKLLHHENSRIRSASLTILGTIGASAKGVIPDLMKMLPPQDTGEKREVIETLVKIGRDSAVPAVELLKSKDWETQLTAYKILTGIGSDAIPAIIPMFREEDPVVRRNAANALGRMEKNGKAAVPALSELLKDKDPTVCSAALNALKDVGADLQPSVPAIVALLHHQDRKVQAEAAQCLGGIGPGARPAVPDLIALLQKKQHSEGSPWEDALLKIGAESVPGLIESLKVKDWKAQQASVIVLGKLGPKAKDAVPALTKLVEDKDSHVEMPALGALKQIGYDKNTMIPAVAKLLHEKNPNAHWSAVEELIKAGPDAIPALSDLLHDESPYTRTAAAKALGKMGEPAKTAIPRLTETLQDKDPEVQLEAFRSLKELGFDVNTAIPVLAKLAQETQNMNISAAVAKELQGIGPAAVPVLIELLDNKRENTRYHAALTLGQMGSVAKAAVPKLTDLLHDKEVLPQQAAVQALEKIGPDAKSAIPALNELLHDKNQMTRMYAVKALSQMEWEAKTAIPIFTGALQDKYYGVQEAAALALSQYGAESKSAIPSLTPLLLQQNMNVKTAAKRAMVKMGSESVPALTAIMRDKDGQGQRIAAETVGEIGPEAKAAIPALTELFHAQDPYLRRMAVDSLRKMGSDAKSAVPALVEALKDQDRAFRFSVVQLLGTLGPEAISAKPALNLLLRDSDSTIQQAANDALKKISQAQNSKSAMPDSSESKGRRIKQPAAAGKTAKERMAEIRGSSHPGDRTAAAKKDIQKPDDESDASEETSPESLGKNIDSAAEKSPSNRMVPAEGGKHAQSFAITPLKLTKPETSVKLPAAFDSVCIGGGGRFLVFYYKTSRKLAVFDICNLKFAGNIATKDDNILYSASASNLLVAYPKKKTLDCYALDTLELESRRELPVKGKITAITVGSASEGPLLVSATKGNSRDASASLLDLKTLTPLDDDWKHHGASLPQSFDRARAAARGNVFGWRDPNGGADFAELLVCEGWNVKSETVVSNGYDAVYPDESGDRIYCSGRMFSRKPTGTNTEKSEGWQDYLVPAIQGPLCVCFPRDLQMDPKIMLPTSTVTVRVAGEKTPLAIFDDVPIRPYNGNDYERRETLPVEDQLFLIPGAQALLILPESKDQILLRRFDLDESLKKWGKDYLFVMSSPPRFVEIGQDFQYQIEVKSSHSPVKLHLDSGPDGMTLSPSGLLRWKVSPVAENAAHVIISLKGDSGKSTFHSFDLVLKRENDSQVSNDAKPSDSPRPVVLGNPLPKGGLRVVPTQIHSSEVVCTLPAVADKVCIGGAGRYLLLHLKSLSKLAVFDICEAKIDGYVDAGRDALFAANARYLVVVDPVMMTFDRYPLDTLKANASQTVKLPARPTTMAMGAASDGPLLVGCMDDSPGRLPQAVLVDVNMLTLVDPAVCKLPRGVTYLPEYQTLLYASADGRVFTFHHGGSPASVIVLRICGHNVKAACLEESAGQPFPDATGQHIYTAAGILSNRVDLQSKRDVDMLDVRVPALEGPFYFRLPSDRNLPLGKTPPHVQLCSNDRDEPLLEIPDDLMQRFMQFGPNGGAHMYNEQWLYYVPKAEAIAMVASSRDAIILRRFDIEKELAKAGKPHLLVMSSPPGIVRLGETYRYQIDARSKDGMVTYKLESGPPGMIVSDRGFVTWEAKDRVEGGVTHCIVAISDSSKEIVRHRFAIDVDDGSSELEPATMKMLDERFNQGPKIQPPQPPASPSTPAKLQDENPPKPADSRTFTDATGKFEVEAIFSRVDP